MGCVNYREKFLKKKNLNFKMSIIRRRVKKKLRRKKRKNKLHLDNKVNISNEFYCFLKKSTFNTKKRSRIVDGNIALIKIPPVFSLIKNPDECIKVYSKIMCVFNDRSIDGVFFDHSECRELEMGASTVMDVFVMNLEKHKRNRGRKFSLGGRLPKNEKNKTMLSVSGIVKHLEFDELEKEAIDSYRGEIRRLDLLSGGKSTSTYKVNNSLTSDIVATEVADYFEECIETQNLAIKPEGKSYIGQLVGETINNCQLHSGDFSQFYTLGHYFTEEGSGFGECQIVIFNFGQTIYEGLKNHTADERTIESLEEITKTHINKGFFKKDWNEELLWTLYSLQDGVSRSKSEDDPDRGTGTVTLIEAFQNIGGTSKGKSAEMSIISGKSHIYFDEKYKIKKQQRDDEQRDIIAFNENNNLEEPPDKDYVKKLKNYFPGTIICLDFYLDKDYITKRQEDLKNGN